MRKAIVIGGSSGIGAGIAELCAIRGHRVITMQRRPGEGDYVELDLRWDQHRILAAVRKAIDQLEGIDWLVIAGGAGAYTMPRVRFGQVEEMIQTNYIGPRYVFDAAVTELRRKPELPSSRVLYISSTIVRNPTKALEDYAASKAAGETFFRAVGKRFAKWGIRSNVLATGWIETPMTAQIDEEIKAKILRMVPLHRWGRVVEVADAAYSILGGPDFWNGDVINFSGGL